MTTSDDMASFLSTVDSIQSRFMESLITGRREALFPKAQAERSLEPEIDPNQTPICSQEGLC
jgi:hypothetical protein